VWRFNFVDTREATIDCVAKGDVMKQEFQVWFAVDIPISKHTNAREKSKR